MEYIPVQELSNMWDISKRRIQVLCKEGRISGAKMIGNMWVVPSDAERPSDARTKNPIVNSCTDIAPNRKNLKKLLKSLYDSCEKKAIPAAERKDYVLTILSSVLCAYYLNIRLGESLLRKVYYEISDNPIDVVFDTDDIELVNKYVLENDNDVELEDLVSWAYQYSNKYVQDNEYIKTQFFTEKYMIKFLVEKIGISVKTNKILDPCVGGGNFLVECFEELCALSSEITRKSVFENSKKLYGFDIDNKITKIAVINIRLRGLAILKRNNLQPILNDWDYICPNIFMSSDGESIQGSLTIENKNFINVVDNRTVPAKTVLSKADYVLTNPPFASIKGMKQEQKCFLKQTYSKAHCDTCVAFMEAIRSMLMKDGKCGIVSQSAWLFLKSFEEARKFLFESYSFEKIVNLGSGAFQDLSGEKSNVSLIIFSNIPPKSNVVETCNVQSENYSDKVLFLKSEMIFQHKLQNDVDYVRGFDFSEKNILSDLELATDKYNSVAIPMQGTSTGNSKELVGYFWEHFNDEEWISVSNGGGYSRWQGLNDSVVRWGIDAEYIKAQKGSALRNTKYFAETQMVFSDTGTAGLNVRILIDNQIFIASGPGIRIIEGNPYAHLAFLNSRYASLCIRQMSPKLTIAAGYIGNIPISRGLFSSIVLEKNARLCTELKKHILSFRPTNLEYTDTYIANLPAEIDNAAWYLFNEDLTNELMKLELEEKIDVCILDELGLSDEARKILDDSVGKCAYMIDESVEVDLVKLDKYLDNLLDSSCCLKRTKNSKNALGSDGYLEYIAKDLGVSPELIVRKIQEAPFSMSRIIKKYKDLILHNYVLWCMGYDTTNGVSKIIQVKDIKKFYGNKFLDISITRWIYSSFNEVHNSVFKGRPYLICENGVLRKK